MVSSVSMCKGVTRDLVKIRFLIGSQVSADSGDPGGYCWVSGQGPPCLHLFTDYCSLSVCRHKHSPCTDLHACVYMYTWRPEDNLRYQSQDLPFCLFPFLRQVLSWAWKPPLRLGRQQIPGIYLFVPLFWDYKHFKCVPPLLANSHGFGGSNLDHQLAEQAFAWLS